MPQGLRILSPLRLPFRQAGTGRIAPLSIAFRAGPIPRVLPVRPIPGARNQGGARGHDAALTAS